MKRILVPTDFSDHADNAFDFALQIAHRSKSKVTLLHVYRPPGTMIDISDVLEEQAVMELDRQRKAAEKAYPDVQVETVARLGYPVDEVLRVARHCDLVVMGTQGVNSVGGRLFGSNTSQLIRRTKAPVLAVPADKVFRLPEHLALATDLDPKSQNLMIGEAEALAGFLKVPLTTVNVMVEGNEVAEVTSQGELGRKPVGKKVYRAKTVPGGLRQHIRDHSEDWLVVVAKEHGLIDRVMKRSITRKMVEEAGVPILAIHE